MAAVTRVGGTFSITPQTWWSKKPWITRFYSKDMCMYWPNLDSMSMTILHGWRHRLGIIPPLYLGSRKFNGDSLLGWIPIDTWRGRCARIRPTHYPETCHVPIIHSSYILLSHTRVHSTALMTCLTNRCSLPISRRLQMMEAADWSKWGFWPITWRSSSRNWFENASSYFSILRGVGTLFVISGSIHTNLKVIFPGTRTPPGLFISP